MNQPIHPDFGEPIVDQPELQQEPQRKWAGKYNSPDQLEDAHEHLQSTLTQYKRELDELRQQINGYGLPDNRQQPAERVAAREKLESLGVPADAVLELADEMFRARLEPIVQTMEARRYITKTYPEYEQIEDRLVEFLQGDPELLGEYQRTYQQASPRVAIEWALMQYQRANPAGAQRATRPQDAQMPPNTTNRLANVGHMSSSEDADAALWEGFMKTRNPQALLKHRLQGTRDTGHFQRGPYGS